MLMATCTVTGNVYVRRSKSPDHKFVAFGDIKGHRELVKKSCCEEMMSVTTLDILE